MGDQDDSNERRPSLNRNKKRWKIWENQSSSRNSERDYVGAMFYKPPSSKRSKYRESFKRLVPANQTHHSMTIEQQSCKST